MTAHPHMQEKVEAMLFSDHGFVDVAAAILVLLQGAIWYVLITSYKEH
jgi:hypothetical protein